MFLPQNIDTAKLAEQEKKDACKRLEEWTIDLLPEALRDDNVLVVSVSEVECGDPKCSPIDTVILFTFLEGGQNMVTIGAMAKDVRHDFFKDYFPTLEVLEKWRRGEEAEWPPEEKEQEEEESYRPPPRDLPLLRFGVGMKTLCLVGEMDWRPGTIVALWHHEKHWPEDSFAPYRVKLDNGSEIFAPVDTDQVIRRRLFY